MLTTQVGNLGRPTQRATHIRVLIHRHLHPVAAAANHYTTTVLAFVDGASQQMCKIGIVNTLRAIGAEILHLKTLILKVVLHHLLQFKTCMIAGHRYNFFHIQAC